jgi:hypothetical protein
MTTSPDPGDVVLVPVPRKYLGAVYAALGTVMASDDVEPAPASEAVPADEVLVDQRNGSWTEAMVRRLHANLVVYPAAKALLDLCALRAPDEVTLAQVAEECDIKATQVRAELGAMTKMVKRMFGRKTWPVSVRWSGGVANYSMKPKVAEWWATAER